MATTAKKAPIKSVKQIEEEAKKSWERLYRGTLVEVPVTFGSHIVEQQYRRQFLVFGRNAHFISKISRILLSETEAQTAENILNKSINKVLTEIQASMERLRTLADAAGVKNLGIKHNSVTLVAPLTSPIQRRLLSVLEMADDEINLLHTLWIMGEIAEKDRATHELKLKRAIMSLSITSRNMYIDLRKRIDAATADGTIRADADESSSDEEGGMTADADNIAEVKPKTSRRSKKTETSSADTTSTEALAAAAEVSATSDSTAVPELAEAA